LPVVAVDGHIVSSGIYPSRSQLMQKLALMPETTAQTVAVPAIESACCKPNSGCC